MSDAASPSVLLLVLPFAAVGVLALIAGVVLLTRGIMARLFGSMVDAEVVDREVHRVPVAELRAPGGVGGATVTPQVRYRDLSGRERTARLNHQVSQRLRSERYRLRYPLGARVRVLIDPCRPDIAHEGSVGAMLVFPGLLVVAGALLSLLALGIMFG